MAKNNQQKMKSNTGGIQWFLFIMIPLVFALTITLVILTIAGVNVAGLAKQTAANVPVISALVQEEGEAATKELNQETKMQQELAKKQQEINTLTNQNEMNERTIEELNQEIVKLNNRLSDEASTVQASKDAQVKNIAKSFEDMDPENAAAIMSNLEIEIGLLVLKNIPTKERGFILEAMDPAQAASLTNSFINDSTAD